MFKTETVDGVRYEVLNASNYQRRGKQRSVYVPNKVLDVDMGYTCPRCSGATPIVLGHGDQGACPQCGLHMSLSGNALRIWEPTKIEPIP